MTDEVPASELIEAIESALSHPIRSHSAATPGYDLYEVYLFGLAVQAAESIGIDVSFEHADGSPATQLVFRTSPSSIWSTVEGFTHAALWVDGSIGLEVHLGIYLSGKSHVSHEGDIVAIEANEAAAARLSRTDPRSSKTVVVIEAKFHGSNLRLRTGREFLGLATDISGVSSPTLVSSSPGPSVHQLLSWRKRSGHFELVPGSTQENELQAQIATSLRDYLARRS